MPYIKTEDRPKFDIALKAIQENTPTNAGELNFLISSIALLYLTEKGQKYQTYNDIMGALEGVKLEFYRRSAAPYEDEKINENGDIF